MLDTSAVTIFDEDEDEDVEDTQETNGESISKHGYLYFNEIF